MIGGFVDELASQRISHEDNKPCKDDKYDGKSGERGIVDLFWR
ncbi:hypothetical protein GKODMF_06910 [Candidatus Electrothrix gigas]